MRLSPDGRLLFAVNSGDNSVSSFRITDAGLKLVDPQLLGSHSAFAVSLAGYGQLLYVLDEGSGTITGLRISRDGELTVIANSTRALSSQGAADGADGAAAQIGLSPDGRVVNVTERLTDTIDTFQMSPAGTPGSAEPTHTPADMVASMGSTIRWVRLPGPRQPDRHQRQRSPEVHKLTVVV